MRSVLISLVTLLIFGGGGYYGYTSFFARPETEAAAPAQLQTAQVRRGDILLTAGGIGTLFAGEEIKAGFGSSGIVGSVAVQVGDRVEAGQILARLAYDSVLNSQLVSAQINLRLAEIALSDLTGEVGGAELAAARSNLAAAQAEYDRLVAPPTAGEVEASRSELISAQSALQTLLAGPSRDTIASLQADLKAAEVARAEAQAAYDRVAWRNDVGSTTQAADLQTATLAYEKALAQYNINTAGASEDAVESARARVLQAQNTLNLLLKAADPMDLAAAQARVEQNRVALEELLAGPTADQLETAELAVQQARLSVEDVQNEIEGGTVRAPIAGVVTAVSIRPGDAVSMGPIISLADVDTGQVRFWIEELDVAAAVPGFPVSIVFEAFPEYTFSGQITRVEPALVDVDGAAAIQAWASIDLNQHAAPLLFGMNAEVEIIAGEARNALLVPVQSLREIAPGQSAVFVVGRGEELEFRPVQVGLKNFVNAEILAGLEVGETVSTGDVQVGGN
ncbi:MAG: efflux RND transporter periplasmic adaptor subunit [Caldilineaceae bacterium]|nr:efflux RND transporter periplasmic adaptor subunit [Caldilineaceae bacterium]